MHTRDAYARVYEVGFTPGEESLVSFSSATENITLWDTNSWDVIKRISIPYEEDAIFRLSPDGAYFASSTLDDKFFSVRTWNAQLVEETSSVNIRAFDRERRLDVQLAGEWIAYPRHGGIEFIHRVSGETVSALEGHKYSLSDIIHSSDGNRIITVSQDNQVQMRKAESGELLHTHSYVYIPDEYFYRGPYGTPLPSGPRKPSAYDLSIRKVALHDQTRQLAVAYVNGLIEIRNVDTDSTTLSFVAHETLASDIIFNSDGSHLVTAARDSVLNIWDTRNGRLIQQIALESMQEHSVSLDPGGTLIAGGFAYPNNTLALFDTKTGENLLLPGKYSRYQQPTNYVTRTAFSPDSTYLVASNSNGFFQIWNTRTLQFVGWSDQQFEEFLDIRFTPDNTQVISVHGDGTYAVWDARDADLLYSRTVPLPASMEQFARATIAPDGRSFVTESGPLSSRVIQSWDMRVDDYIRYQIKPSRFSYPDQYIEFTRDGKCMVSTLDDDIVVWDVLSSRTYMSSKNTNLATYLNRPIMAGSDCQEIVTLFIRFRRISVTTYNYNSSF